MAPGGSLNAKAAAGCCLSITVFPRASFSLLSDDKVIPAIMTAAMSIESTLIIPIVIFLLLHYHPERAH